jgi:hypothetical protein
MGSSRLALTAAIFALALVLEGCGSKAPQTGDGGAAAAGGAGGEGGTGGMSDAGAVGGRSGDGGVSPGTVTLRFVLPASQAFCDEACGPTTHIEILTSTGQLVPTAMPFCFTSCAADCKPVSCPVGGACLPHGIAATGDQISWDGSSYPMSTCGTGTSCYAPRFVSPGQYVARMCATPGVLTSSDGGVTSCSATGATECVDVPFDFPGQAVVEGMLAGDHDGGQDSASDRSEAAD